MFSFTKYTKRKRANYAKMIAYSETFIRTITPTMKEHYENAVKNSYLPPFFDSIYRVLKRIDVDHSLSDEMNAQGHLYYGGNRTAQFMPYVSTGQFMHWVVIMLNESITDASRISNFKNCSEKYCMNPSHYTPVFFTDEQYDNLRFRASLRDDKEQEIVENEKIITNDEIFDMVMNEEPVENDADKLVVNGELVMSVWEKIHGKNLTKEARRLSRLMCHSRKVTFASSVQAKKFNKSINGNNRVYQCVECHYYHLTKSQKLPEKTLRKRMRSANMVY